MDQVYIVGYEGVLFDNLAASSKDDAVPSRCFAMEQLPAALEQIRRQRPTWVVFCGHGARSSWDSPTNGILEDVEHVQALAVAAREASSNMALVSSDRVFNGPRMFCDENQPVADDAVSRDWVAVEQALVAASPGASLILRTNVIGRSAAADSFAERIWQSLTAGRRLELSATTFANPILAGDLIDVLSGCFRARLTGILHVGGAERTSPFHFAETLALVAGLDRHLVSKKQETLPQAEPTECPSETSLASRRVRQELNRSLPMLRETIVSFVEQAENERRQPIQDRRNRESLRAA